MNKIVGLKEFRENVAGYASKVRGGKSFIIVRRSRPLFRVAPISGLDEEWEEVIDFTRVKKGGIKIKDLLERL